MTDAQTEARAIAWEVRGAQLHRVFLDETEARELAGRFNGAVIPLVHATALAAKDDAELATAKLAQEANHNLAVANGNRAREEYDRAERAEAALMQKNGELSRTFSLLKLEQDRAERAEAHLAEARKALEANSNTFEAISNHIDECSLPLAKGLCSQGSFTARRALEAQGGE